MFIRGVIGPLRPVQAFVERFIETFIAEARRFDKGRDQGDEPGSWPNQLVPFGQYRLLAEVRDNLRQYPMRGGFRQLVIVTLGKDDFAVRQIAGSGDEPVRMNNR
jgi:hypothetical protein